MSSSDFIRRVLNADEKLSAAERGAPSFTDQRRDAAWYLRESERRQLSKAELDAWGQLQRAGRRPSTAVTRAKAEKHELNQYRLMQKAQEIGTEVVAALEDDDAWVEDEDEGYVNHRLERAVATLWAMGEPGAVQLAYIYDNHDEGGVLEDVFEMLAERDQLRAMKQTEAAVEQEFADYMKGETAFVAEVDKLLRLNAQFRPDDPALEAEIAHALDQARRAENITLADGTNQKAAFIADVKRLQLEQARRAAARQEAEQVFVEMASNAEDKSFDQLRTLFIGALNVADETYQSVKGADRYTRQVLAEADAAGISEDSRDASNKIVMVDAYGKNPLYVEDSGVGGLLQAGYTRIRDFQALPDPDYMAALGPQHDPEVAAQSFADDWNRREEAGELEGQGFDLQAEHERMAKASAETEAERAQVNHKAQLAEMNRLARPDGKDSVPEPDPFATS